MLSPRVVPRRLRKKEERELLEKQRELEELERDTRTVFAHNLPTKADERDIFQFFSQARRLRAAHPHNHAALC